MLIFLGSIRGKNEMFKIKQEPMNTNLIINICETNLRYDTLDGLIGIKVILCCIIIVKIFE